MERIPCASREQWWWQKCSHSPARQPVVVLNRKQPYDYHLVSVSQRISELSRGCSLIHSHVILHYLSFKQGKRFQSQELWKLHLDISHSRRLSHLKFIVDEIRVQESEEWKDKGRWLNGLFQPKWYCDSLFLVKLTFHKMSLQRSKTFMDFLLFSLMFRVDDEWIKIRKKTS